MTEHFDDIDYSLCSLEILDGICNHLFEKDFMFITREEQVDIYNVNSYP